jgi:hypothetical protein
MTLPDVISTNATVNSCGWIFQSLERNTRMTTVGPITISVSRSRNQRNVLGMNFEGQSASKNLCDFLLISSNLRMLKMHRNSEPFLDTKNA